MSIMQPRQLTDADVKRILAESRGASDFWDRIRAFKYGGGYEAGLPLPHENADTYRRRTLNEAMQQTDNTNAYPSSPDTDAPPKKMATAPAEEVAQVISQLGDLMQRLQKMLPPPGSSKDEDMPPETDESDESE